MKEEITEQIVKNAIASLSASASWALQNKTLGVSGNELLNKHLITIKNNNIVEYTELGQAVVNFLNRSTEEF